MGSDTHSAVLGLGGRGTSRTQLSSIMLASFFTSVFWWLFFLFPSDIISSPRKFTKTFSCGNSTIEAKARGCQFDVLSFLWVPEPCFDAETAAAYQRAVNWHGHNEAKSKEMLDLAAMAERVEPGKYYTTAKEHAVHCAYIWQKQHKGFLKGGLYLDDNSASFHHTRHCSEVLMYTAELEPEKLASFTTETTVGFSSCLVEI